MKEPSATEDGKFLAFNGWGGVIKFYCLQLENPVGFPKFLMLFPVGMRVQCSFGGKFSADFSFGEGYVRLRHWHLTRVFSTYQS